MAVIWEKQYEEGRVLIDDACLKGVGQEEQRRRQEQLEAALLRVLCQAERWPEHTEKW